MRELRDRNSIEKQNGRNKLEKRKREGKEIDRQKDFERV